ncbi:MAG: hydroxyacid dehydrogenase [Firmicutes bacterium]|nr:hydroxyacid dehydrogenase [Bacillota bacterium]
MATITFFEIQKGDRPFYNKHLAGHKLLYSGEILTADLAADFRETEILSVFVHSRVTKEVLNELPKLRLIATRSAGFNHIDLAAAAKRNIPVCYVPAYGEYTVAEHTFALILSLSRNIHKAYFRTARENFSLAGLKGFDLKNKTIGVVGAGRIGLHVIKIARGFDMQVLAVDPKPDPFLAEVLQFRYAPLEEVLAKADIITLHAPLNQNTYHLLNKDNIPLIKKGALLINTARGELVETEALLKALDAGIIAGAGLDVLEGEELFVEEEKLFDPEVPHETLSAFLKSQRLFNREDVVITPHIGFNSQEAVLRIRYTTADNINAFLAGRPQNLIDTRAVPH